MSSRASERKSFFINIFTDSDSDISIVTELETLLFIQKCLYLGISNPSMITGYNFIRNADWLQFIRFERYIVTRKLVTKFITAWCDIIWS